MSRAISGSLSLESFDMRVCRGVHTQLQHDFSESDDKSNVQKSRARLTRESLEGYTRHYYMISLRVMIKAIIIRVGLVFKRGLTRVSWRD